jgi:hypothetical protein
MAWSDDSTPEGVASDVDDGFMDAGILLKPRETIQFDIERTDSSPTEPWGFEVYASIDGTTWGSRPIAAGRWEVGDLFGNIVVTGPKYVTGRILNADPTPVDVVEGDVTYSTDQVSL